MTKNKKQFQLWLDNKRKEHLQAISQKERYSMSAVVDIAIEYLFTGVENGHTEAIRKAYNELNNE